MDVASVADNTRKFDTAVMTPPDYAINRHNDTNRDAQVQQQQSIVSTYARPTVQGEGLRRQPTRYPHGLCISLQTDSDEHSSNYSRASTLRSCWEDSSSISTKSSVIIDKEQQQFKGSSPGADRTSRKHRISMLNSPESLAELQMRRSKYPLTGNYYLDAPDACHKPPSPLVLHQYTQRFCRWKFLRWPIIFVASTLLFFGLITYCIWLHDVSVARERFLFRRRQQIETAETAAEDELISYSFETTDRSATVSSLATPASSSQRLQESTILRAITYDTRQRQQTLTTRAKITAPAGKWQKTTQWQDNAPTPTTIASTTSTTTTTTEITTYASAAAALVPTNVLHYAHYNGHQNSFGVPIEEDERILRLYNSLLPLQQSNGATTQSASTLTKAKVSPTIPPLPQFKPTHAMQAASRTTAQENGCYSTSLPMCQGVLSYDLTYNSTVKLPPLSQEAFESLIATNCSARALEFICTALEPECQPRHIGTLPPCRRICKAILEACSIVIANWDVLNELFDCSLYPDSSDANKCDDPTRRRDYCYENEFMCYDHTCIPQQWQCDNIKDCADGEDEDSCLVCEQQDEFRCRSNEKCVPESVRCDSKYDCFDGSDEEECEEYGSGDESATAFDEAALNSFPRVFSYASFLSPNQSNEGLYTYITAATDDESGTRFQVHEITNRTAGVSNEEVTNAVPGDGPRGFVNFRDSKEIMMTSDTENKFKYSAATKATTVSSTRAAHANRATNRNDTFEKATTPLQPAASLRIAVTTEASPRTRESACAAHQLRCVSGECIGVHQLCDKKIDCPDGADELMCVYKERTSTTSSTTMRSNSRGSATSSRNISVISTTTPARADKRTTRTTIKRKLKT